MVTIRLSRLGRKKAPFYRIVATDSRKKAIGEVLEVLGTWNPAHKELEVRMPDLNKWVEKGAQMSATVKKLLEENKK
jgi:small subunit ribosomal protein S16